MRLHARSRPDAVRSPQNGDVVCGHRGISGHDRHAEVSRLDVAYSEGPRITVDIFAKPRWQPVIRSECPQQRLGIQEPGDHTYGSHSGPSSSKSGSIQI